ncbi:unnamed protein product [Vitrella brassicaformis CCMP3155]|uniref:CBM20 domain-containing protein n=1 Tax=Vitrella brassicaformis (strain CCMP3155) TaxID=1169540 RepID=A0A0G4EN90_VITBC|nr:unnamed protein product [Vitrella brassicaformis CCMP3155]|eukprot:CEL98494.1 unnamed protein product [Vitrella brassicaformis CCMP3155]
MSSFGKFKISCNTSLGESVRVVGNIDELGSWDVSNALLMATDGDNFPVWSSPVTEFRSSKSGMQIEYKYVITKPGDQVSWEDFSINRMFIMPEASNFAVNDGKFGDVTTDGKGQLLIEGPSATASAAPPPAQPPAQSSSEPQLVVNEEEPEPSQPPDDVDATVDVERATATATASPSSVQYQQRADMPPGQDSPSKSEDSDEPDAEHRPLIKAELPPAASASTEDMGKTVERSKGGETTGATLTTDTTQEETQEKSMMTDRSIRTEVPTIAEASEAPRMTEEDPSGPLLGAPQPPRRSTLCRTILITILALLVLAGGIGAAVYMGYLQIPVPVKEYTNTSIENLKGNLEGLSVRVREHATPLLNATRDKVVGMLKSATNRQQQQQTQQTQQTEAA